MARKIWADGVCPPPPPDATAEQAPEQIELKEVIKALKSLCTWLEHIIAWLEKAPPATQKAMLVNPHRRGKRKPPDP
jgi:hypothetical protein